MSRRPRRVRRRYVQRRRHWWRDLITSEFYNATHAWFLAAEAESLGYATELEEYAAEHPRPTLKGFMVALARPDRHQPDQPDQDHDHSTTPRKDRPMTQQPDTLSTALDYAARGWRVFPLLPGSKRPATPNHRAADCDGTDAWCRTGHAGWEQRATSRPDWITRAWSSNPAYGVGIACGPSRLVVVDLDTHKPGSEIPEPWHRFGITTGEDVLDHLAGAHGGTITPTYTVRTVSGGTHLYYQAPDTTRRLANSAGKVGWLIDTRAHGGYVAAPPTTIGTSAYTVVDDRRPAPLPWFLLDLLSHDQRPAPSTVQNGPQQASNRPARPVGSGEPVRHASAYVDKVLAAEIAALQAAPAGGRNTALWCAATNVGKLVRRGLITEHAAFDALLTAAAGHIAAGAYTAYDAENSIRSGFHRAATRSAA